MDILDIVGEFTWMFGVFFFVETSQGNFLWSDPDYGGDNTLKPYKGSYKDCLADFKMPFGRDKGKHIIRDYCGDSVVVVMPE